MSEQRGGFSTDLDFTGLEEHDHENIILDMMKAFEKDFHGIKFHIPDDSYYEIVIVAIAHLKRRPGYWKKRR